VRPRVRDSDGQEKEGQVVTNARQAGLKPFTRTVGRLFGRREF
jgi:hypothetical protein